MKDFFLDIFKYHHHYNQLLLQEIQAHQAELPPTVSALFSHSLNAHQVWNARILQTTPFHPHQQHPIAACAGIDDQNLQDTIKILMETDLSKKIDYTNSSGESYTNTVREILFHVANHHTHHRGQIVATFRQSGIPPIVTDYIFYKR